MIKKIVYKQIQNMKMNKLKYSALTILAAGMLTACGNLSDVSKEGTTDNPVFPDVSKVKFNHDGDQKGSWPNWNNVNMIEAGMNKSQIQNLIGIPHFSEGFVTREWDYLFNYRDANGEHKTCQYKILFDKNMNAQSFFWHPYKCGEAPEVKQVANFSLSGDFSFDFDKYTLTQEGKRVVDEISQQLILNNAKHVNISGFTDILGSESYNIALSQKRADTVKNRMLQNGVTAQIYATGYGKNYPIVICEGGSGKALKDCLRPNRRVEISAFGNEKYVPQFAQEVTENNL